jgi:invasion protein IalB
MKNQLGASFVAIVVGVFLGLQVGAGHAADVGQKFGNWVHECEAVASNKTSCFLSYTHVIKKTNRRFLTLLVGKFGPKNESGLIVFLPLGIYLPSGVVANIDNGKKFNLTVQQCIAGGCRATIALTKKRLKSLRAGQQLSIEFRMNLENEPIIIGSSLKGITKGLQAIKLK